MLYNFRLLIRARGESCAGKLQLTENASKLAPSTQTDRRGATLTAGGGAVKLCSADRSIVTVGAISEGTSRKKHCAHARIVTQGCTEGEHWVPRNVCLYGCFYFFCMFVLFVCLFGVVVLGCALRNGGSESMAVFYKGQRKHSR